jgi:hypothetical protein
MNGIHCTLHHLAAGFAINCLGKNSCTGVLPTPRGPQIKKHAQADYSLWHCLMWWFCEMAQHSIEVCGLIFLPKQ